MKPASKHLLSRCALALLTLLGGIPAHLLANDTLGDGTGRNMQFGNDGVGGIEKTGQVSGPTTPHSPGSRHGGPVLAAMPLAEAGAWLDLGEALGPAVELPTLSGAGSGEPGTVVTLTLSHAKPGAVAALVVGVTTLDAPFKGGTLIPKPLLIVPGLPVNAQGTLALPALLPAALPAGFSLYLQMWMPDAAAPKGFAASNGLQLEVQ